MNLFVYGTLLFPEIRFALLNKQIEYKEAILKEYSAVKFYYDLKEMEYPILRITPNKKVNGLLLLNLSKSDINILTYYEGDDYKFEKVELIVEDTAIEENAFFFKYPEQIRYSTIWNKEHFANIFLNDYINIHIPQMLSEMELSNDM